MKSVVFVQRMVPDYRAKFFYILRDVLESEGIKFHLVAGKTRKGEALKDAFPVEQWSSRCNNIYLSNKLYYQNAYHLTSKADLVIVHEGGTALINYELLLRRKLIGSPKVAFFGHGVNMNIGRRTPLRSMIKNYIALLPDWWFAYTNISLKTVTALGYPENRTTVINNSIDTRGFISSLSRIDLSTLKEIQKSLNIHENDTVGLFCGRLSKIKVSFLIDAAMQIRQNIKNYQLIIIGRGDLEKEIQEFSRQSNWLHYVGSKFGEDRMPYFRIANHFLMPGQVGLGILDAFAAGLPFFTTDCGIHSPEIAYLNNGKNGYMTKNNIDDYSKIVSECVGNYSTLKIMSEAAEKTAKDIDFESMVSNFSQGIKKILF